MFLLDIKYDMINNQIIKWIKYKDKDCKSIRETYYPKIYVSYSDSNTDLNLNPDLNSLIPIILSLHGVKDASVEEKKLLNDKKVKVICISLERNYIFDVASILEEKYELYNIDVDVIRQYLLEHSLYPFANNKDSQYDIDYEFPELKSVELIIPENFHNNFNQKIDYVHIRTGDNIRLQTDTRSASADSRILEGNEPDILYELNKEILNIDPDLIYTNNGDSYELPYLYHRASLHNINLQLGREKDIFNGEERSFFSYGRILYKPKKYILSGRLHIDKSYFMFREGGLSGIIDISRITGIPLQELSRLSPGSAITALQLNQAIRDNIIIPWKRYNAEYWKTAEELLIADRGALVLEPKIGIHENVFELDYASLFPNIMVKYNISPETVLCKCCGSDKTNIVPFIRYHICKKNIGLVPRVLKPVIERRMEFKRRSKLYKSIDLKLSEEYNERQNLLKWLLVTSFGYMGFNKAIFGRIECHESITAYARDILLRSIEIADDLGYDILHGIVDCLWVKGKDPEKLCDFISKEIGINLEFKGKFNWIVFLPNKTNSAGSLNRYYGVMEDDKLKIRGIESRRSDTPLIIKNLQLDIISKLAEAKNIPEFYLKIPETIEILKEYTEKVISNECDFDHLIFQTNISREYDKYQQFNNQVAALLRLKEKGINIRPGQFVRYIIADHKSKDYHKRIILPEFIDENDNVNYDATKYYQYLLKGAESILLPFGYTENVLDDILKRRVQKKLFDYELK